MRYLIGIDEAGRGPLAGPVAVGAVMVPRGFDFSILAGAKDSKQMAPLAREELYARLVALRRRGALDFSVSFSAASVIDRRGIVPAIRSALLRCLAKLEAKPNACEIHLDGSLAAPAQFKHQTTIIRGDQLEPVISLASIAAKVERDRLMVRFARSYPAYGFDVHKGYGTLAHRRSIARSGLSDLHRASFCTRLQVG